MLPLRLESALLQGSRLGLACLGSGWLARLGSGWLFLGFGWLSAGFRLDFGWISASA